MIPVKSYAAQKEKDNLAPYNFERRDPRPQDVVIEILYCGVCHTDIHLRNNDWGISIYPMVPGHEIIGRVIAWAIKLKNLKKVILPELVVLLIPAVNVKIVIRGLNSIALMALYILIVLMKKME